MKTVIARNEASPEPCVTDKPDRYRFFTGGLVNSTKKQLSLRAIAWQSRRYALRICMATRLLRSYLTRSDKRVMSFFTILLLSSTITFAQSTYDNNVYLPEIKSVEFYNTAKQASFPIITLFGSEKVLLAFDDLKGGTRTFNYTIEHCDANWNSSNIATAEYLKNFQDDRIRDYSYSTNTRQKYTHYQLNLPNENIAPKIPGNYILKVYEDGDQTNMVLTRRLYVVTPKIGISGEIVPSSDVSVRQSNQKINFTLNYGSLRVQNPGGEVRALVMQNARSETSQLNSQPTYIGGTQLVYSDVGINDFVAGNEFRHFDSRTLKVNSEHIFKIVREATNTAYLLIDPDQEQPNYSFQYDLNGSFYILNQDGIDPTTDADYVHMIFGLSTKRRPADGAAYIIGRFNDFKADEHSKMGYDEVSGRYIGNLFLKQGVYDYRYVWVYNNGKWDDKALEGSHFETENDYQILVYYRPAGSRWEELVGFQQLNTGKK